VTSTKKGVGLLSASEEEYFADEFGKAKKPDWPFEVPEIIWVPEIAASVVQLT
jgi:hypothetical protein